MLSIAVLTAAALFSASAFAAPAIEARSEILCTGQSNLLTTLRIYSESSSEQQTPVGGVLLGTDPVRNANGSEMLQSYNGNGVEQFMFYSCQSTYMNYPPTQDLGNGTVIYYGQLRSASNGSCLVDSDNSIVLSPCSTADDVSQTSQFWKATQDFTEAAVLNFVGTITNGQPTDEYYSFGYGYLGGNAVVSAGYHPGSLSTADYVIKMVAA